MKFIADVMLGRLAKRLRLLGFDVLYVRTLNNNEIIRLSLEQDRVILTRDMALSDRPLAENHLFIKSDLVQEQVEQVLLTVPLETPLNPLSRCSECNDLLDRILREEVRDLVPHHVFENQEVFLRCPRCNRLYWHGTHVMRMAILGRKKQTAKNS
ncbi:MAG: Mut7-C RNAse domain-containing protein [Nitrospirae bacterium]|nr:Mut7-C RNAse domain-containing protein [Nitrospirota bacterium]